MKKGIFSIAMANVICMALGLITNFLLPKHLSVDSYAMLKTYSLYMNYAGFFAFGYSDSVYLKYGGKKLGDLNAGNLSNNFYNYSLVIATEAILAFIGGIILKNNILTAFSLGMFAYNIMGYLKILLQATGEFSTYARALNIEKIVIFIINVAMIFAFKVDSYLWYVWAQIATGFLVTICFVFIIQKSTGLIQKSKFCVQVIVSNIKDGYVLMLGNFSSGIFTGIDRWFVKFLLNSKAFAVYSFAVSTENIINVFVSPITVSMYNWFCKSPNNDRVKFIKRVVMIWGFIIIGGMFFIKFIIKYYLPQYMDACEVIIYLLGAQVFYLIVKGIYVNIYKSNKQQNRYFLQLLAMTVVAFILNTIFFLINSNIRSIAFATYCTSIIWLIVCEIKNCQIAFGMKDWIFIIIGGITYIYAGFYFSPVWGIIAYYSIILILTIVIERDCFIYGINNIRSLKESLLKNVVRK